MPRCKKRDRNAAPQGYPPLFIDSYGNDFFDKRIEEAIKDLESNTRKLQVPIPVSTRGVGLSSAELFTRATAEQRLPATTITPQQLYRVQLAMIEYVIAKNRSQATLSNPENWYNPINFDPYMKEITSTGVCYTTQRTGVLIKSISSFKFNDIKYVPTFPREINDANGRMIPTPEFVYFSNLRRTVEYLNDPVTDRGIRINFRNKNPIPGANWDRENHTLTNPDDIMPSSYRPADLINDLHMVNNWIYSVMIYHPKWCNMVTLDSLGPGNESLLVSNEHKPQPHTLHLEGLTAHGDVERHWLLYPISKEMIFYGIYHLAGEIASVHLYRVLCSIRSYHCSPDVVTNGSYREAVLTVELWR